MKKINPKFAKLKFVNDFISSVIALFIRKVELRCGEKNVVILDMHLLGDAVLDLPLIEALISEGKNVCYITGSWNKPLFSNVRVDFEILYLDCPWIRRASLVNFIRQLRYIKSRLSDREWGYSVDVRGDFRNILILCYLKVGGIVTFDWTGGKFLISKIVNDDGTYKHLAMHNVMILNSLGINCKFEDYLPELRLNEVLPKNNFNNATALIHFGASMPMRVMPIKQVRSVLLKIRKNHKKVIFVIDPKQSGAYSEVVTEYLRELDFEFSIWKGVLEELICIINTVTTVYAMDSGIAHLAAAMGKHVIVFFGPSDKRLVGPIGKSVRYVEGKGIKTGACLICDHNKCKAPVNMQCYQGISTEMI